MKHAANTGRSPIIASSRAQFFGTFVKFDEAGFFIMNLSKIFGDIFNFEFDWVYFKTV